MQVRFASWQFRAPWWAVALAVAGSSLFVALGLWQWQRAAYKRGLQDSYAALGASVHVAGSVATLPRYSKVEVRGRYDAQRQFLLDNLTRDGVAGYEILAPLLLDTGRVLLVNRGWIPLPAQQRKLLPELGFVAEDYRSVRGRVDALPVTGLASGRVPPAADGRWPQRTSFPRMDDLAAALGREVEPWQLLLDAAEPHGFRRDWRPGGPEFGPERHTAYAVQWFGLAALAWTVLAVVNTKKLRQ